MSRSLTLCLLSIIALITFSGCHTYTPASITENRISNPTVGLNGYTAIIPEGYQSVELDAPFWDGKTVYEILAEQGLDPYNLPIRGGEDVDYIILHNAKTKSLMFLAVRALYISYNLSQVPDDYFHGFTTYLSRKIREDAVKWNYTPWEGSWIKLNTRMGNPIFYTEEHAWVSMKKIAGSEAYLLERDNSSVDGMAGGALSIIFGQLNEVFFILNTSQSQTSRESSKVVLEFAYSLEL